MGFLGCEHRLAQVSLHRIETVQPSEECVERSVAQRSSLRREQAPGSRRHLLLGDDRPDPAPFFPSIEALVAKEKVEAVATFTSTFDHRRVVEACAPLGIDVMMEKPLAVSLEDARAISAAAAKGGIQVIVNYETTWYPSNQGAYDVVRVQHSIGDVRKIVVCDGHQGPVAIGVSPF